MLTLCIQQTQTLDLKYTENQYNSQNLIKLFLSARNAWLFDSFLIIWLYYHPFIIYKLESSIFILLDCVLYLLVCPMPRSAAHKQVCMQSGLCILTCYRGKLWQSSFFALYNVWVRRGNESFIINFCATHWLVRGGPLKMTTQEDIHICGCSDTFCRHR